MSPSFSTLIVLGSAEPCNLTHKYYIQLVVGKPGEMVYCLYSIQLTFFSTAHTHTHTHSDMTHLILNLCSVFQLQQTPLPKQGHANEYKIILSVQNSPSTSLSSHASLDLFAHKEKRERDRS